VSGCGLDRLGDVDRQLLGALQRVLDADELELAGCDLARRFAALVGAGEFAAVADEHLAQRRRGALLWLGLVAAQADEAAGEVLAGRQRAEVGAHVAHPAAARELVPPSAVGLRSASGPWGARKLPRTALRYSSISVVG
jgi:hypothetical protein